MEPSLKTKYETHHYRSGKILPLKLQKQIKNMTISDQKILQNNTHLL